MSQPAAAHLYATARPMPRDAPVTIAIFPARASAIVRVLSPSRRFVTDWSRALPSRVLFPPGGVDAQDEYDDREHPDHRGVTQRRRVVDRYHGGPESLVHVVQRQDPRDRLQEARHQIEREEAAREEHHREHDEVGGRRRALRLVRDAGEYHPDPAEREDLEHDEHDQPRVDLQPNGEHDVAHYEDRHRAYDREYELVQDIRQDPVGPGDGR